MIIGICGFQSSGKDTIANYLVKEHGFARFSFASALKDIIAIMFKWPREQLEGLTTADREWREEIDPWWANSLKMPHLTPRFVMQHFATELFRKHFHPDIWVKILERNLYDFLYANNNPNIVISDCRFKNEINMIKSFGGEIIQVHRNAPDWFYKYRRGEYSKEFETLHSSETEWIRCHRDYDIENNGTLYELYAKIKYIADAVKL
jgi:hypothetical protein